MLPQLLNCSLLDFELLRDQSICLPKFRHLERVFMLIYQSLSLHLLEATMQFLHIDLQLLFVLIFSSLILSCVLKYFRQVLLQFCIK